MSLTLTLDGAEATLSLLQRRPQLQIAVDGVRHTVEELSTDDPQAVTLLIDGRACAVHRVIEGERVHLQIDGQRYSVGFEEALAGGAGGLTEGEIRAEMPGVVIEVMAGPGQAVATGDALLVIESMKMQITITAPHHGVVELVHVERQVAFQKGAPLISLREPTE